MLILGQAELKFEETYTCRILGQEKNIGPKIHKYNYLTLAINHAMELK